MQREFGAAADAKLAGRLFRYVAAESVAIEDVGVVFEQRAVGLGVDVARGFGGGVDEQSPFLAGGGCGRSEFTRFGPRRGA